ncbi:hypothetical protein [Denitrobacterium detoxificans]|jgi:hypothetical protein|uniref:hypothetical protein n=1 Tax=Denitrobacterium detoxificans TaxID=79604 RepID=UPI0026F01D21|nr:hypothetical protein [Denitrobacterium detoxificans]MBE6466942.1 hypothetical protein [Denitrobacterium detoxificans]
METQSAEAPNYKQQAEELHAALGAALEDIRSQSCDSALVTPERWNATGMAPTWMDTEAFTDAVRDALVKFHASPGELDCGATSGAEQIEPTDEAEAATETPSDEEEAAAVTRANADAADEVDSEMPGEESSTAQNQPASLDEALAALPAIPCADICVLEGKSTTYFYSNAYMTDAYANWAFLAQEDDKVQTFVSVVREDSRVYPRPMVYRSLLNPPFRMTEDEVLQCWQTVQETGKFPDIESCEASNGDVYFFSTDYLSPRYAQSLAEYESVERLANP